MKSLLSELFITQHPLREERAFKRDVATVFFEPVTVVINSITQRPAWRVLELSPDIGGNAKCDMLLISNRI